MARTAMALAIGLAVILAPACSDDPLDPGPADPAVPESPDPASGDSIIVPPRSASAEAAVVEKSNVFAWDLLAAAMAADPEENVLVSPLSASMALGMALNGARGATYDQMQSTLGFADAPLDTINNGYRGLMSSLPAADSTVSTRIANSAWHRNGFEVEPAFLNTVRAFFDAQVAGLDFSDASAADTMNQWVADRTNGRIDRIIEPPIDSRTVLFLINAVYFKGPWQHAFDPAKTQDLPFHIAAGESRQMPMMDQTREFPHGQDGSLQIVDLPFGEGAFAMTLLVPGGEAGIDDEIGSMDETRWESVLGKLTTTRVQVVLPRFRVEYDRSLKEILQSLGMTDAFMSNAADLTGISATPPPLHISEVKQKTFVEVSEEGAEAAGTTSVGIGVTSLPPSVIADRPFAYLIRERESGAILFAGVLRRPPGAG
jgi:serpin B